MEIDAIADLVKCPPQAGGDKEKKRLPEEERAMGNAPMSVGNLGISRIYPRRHFNETCWAYMKLLRENNKTRKVYDIDPYVEVYQFRDNMYGLLTPSLDGGAYVWMYLIIGPEKAMLVDTAWGLGDLKGLVNEITGGMPLIVVNTHCHFDHAYGNAQFDTVYCHQYEAPSLIRQNEHMWDYLFEQDSGEPIWDDFPRGDLITYKPYTVVGCPNNTVFNLGGDYEVEMIFMGGHSAGSAGYLDKKNRIFFAGDDFISMSVGISGPKPGVPFSEYATVTAFRNEVAKLNERTQEFDHIFSGHFVGDIESTVVPNMLKACNEILAAPEKNYTIRTKNKNGNYMYQKYVEGMGVIAYSMNSIL
ncbi:MAG: MBL fold metallo-hydrolase [Oscillospiraceae bacterium]